MLCKSGCTDARVELKRIDKADICVYIADDFAALMCIFVKIETDPVFPINLTYMFLQTLSKKKILKPMETCYCEH